VTSSLTEGWAGGYVIVPPNPPNSGTQIEPPFLNSTAVSDAYFGVFFCPLHIGGAFCSRLDDGVSVPELEPNGAQAANARTISGQQ
jgi:hypothetical protein